MGILYDEDNTVACELPSEQAPPIYIIRHRKPRRSRRRSLRSLPLYLSFSSLGDDADIARLLSPSISNTPTPMTIQHRELPSTPITNTPLSLPDVNGSLSFPDTTLDGWEFITTPQHHTDPQPSPASEPETWILLSDDS